MVDMCREKNETKTDMVEECRRGDGKRAFELVLNTVLLGANGVLSKAV